MIMNCFVLFFCNWRRPFWGRNILPTSEAVYHSSYTQEPTNTSQFIVQKHEGGRSLFVIHFLHPWQLDFPFPIHTNSRVATDSSFKSRKLPCTFITHVAYEWIGAKWKERLTDAVTSLLLRTRFLYNIIQLRNILFIIKSSYELGSMLLRGACRSATPVVGT